MRPPALVLALLWLASPVRAETIGPSDPAELEAFLAGLMPGLMETYHVPGAVFVMVKDGEIFFAKGYGHADLESRRPVDPDSTVHPPSGARRLATASWRARGEASVPSATEATGAASAPT